MTRVGKIILLIASIFVLSAMAGVAGATTASLDSTSYTVVENVVTGTLTVNVVLDSDPGAGVDVTYVINPHTAAYNKNYTITPATNTLHFTGTERSKSITITILDNAIYDINRIFFVNLTLATCALNLTTKDAKVTITEDDPAPTVILLPVTAGDQPYNTNVYEGNSAAIRAILVSNGAGQFTPMGIAANPSNGYLYLADYYNHRVMLFTVDGAEQGRFGSYGTSPGNLQYPYGIAVNSTGYVYVTDATNQVKVYDGAGTFKYAFGSGILNGPRGIGVDPVTDLVYVADAGNNRIVKFSKSGGQVAQTSGYYYPVTGQWQSFSAPTGVAVNSTGYVFIADTGNNLIKVLRNDLSYYTQFSSDVLAVKAPQGIGINPGGDDIYVVDNNNYRVVYYNIENEAYRVYNMGSYGSSPGQFTNPRMIAVYSGRVFVTDSELNRVTYFSTAGDYLGMWGGPFSAVPVSVNYTTTDGTALAGQNYTAADQKITFNAGEYVKTINVGTIQTSGYKPTKYFFVNLTNPVNAVVGAMYPYTMVNILNNNGPNPAPTVRFSPALYTSRKDADNVTLTVIKSGQTELPATIYYTTVDGTATAGQNFTGTTGSITILPGEFSKTFNISLIHTPGYSPNATFNVTLYSPVNAALAANNVNASALITLYTPQTSMPVLQFSTEIFNVNETDGHVLLMVKKIGTTATEASINFHTVDGTAVAGWNYTAASGTLTFAPGEASKTIDIPILNTIGYNPDTVFIVVLESPVNALWGYPSAAIVKIHNVDPAVRLQFNLSTYYVNESDGFVTLNVTKSGITTLQASVNYTTSDGSAKAGMNYTARSGMLTFTPGETFKTFTVPIVHVPGYNGNTSFMVALSNDVNATIDTQSHTTVNIINTDPAPAVQFGSATYTVNDNAGSAVLTVTRSGVTSVSATVTYYTTDVTAVAGRNYTAVTSTLTFASGESTKTISIPIMSSTGYDVDSTFDVSLTDPVNAVIGLPDRARVTIHNVQQAPGLEFNLSSYNVNEDAGTVTINVTKTGATSMAASVDYTTSDVTARAGLNYDSTHGTLTFDPGETSKTFAVPIHSIAGFNADLSFVVTLSNPVMAVPGRDTAMVTIRNVDQIPTLQFDASSVTVNEDAGTVTINLIKIGTTTASSTIIYSTVDGNATAGVNYVNTIGALTFLSWETSKPFTVPLLHWPGYSPALTFNVTLQAPVNANIGTPDNVSVTILNVDPVPRLQFSVSSVTVNEDAGTATISVAKAGASSVAASIDYYTVDGNATAGQNYTAVSGTLTFAPGDMIKTFTVSVANVPGYNPDVAFNVSLRNPVNVTIGTPDNVTVSILNVDGAPSFQFDVAGYTIAENVASLTVTVTKTGVSSLPTSVDYATADGPARAGTHYGATSGRLDFPAGGDASQTFTVSISYVPGYTPQLNFTITLSNPKNATIGVPSVTVNITNIDPMPTVQFASTAYEVNENAGSITVTLTKTGVAAAPVTVSYSTVDGTAKAGQNYTATSGTVTFQPGDLTKTISIPVTYVPGFKLNNSFNVTISNPANATIGTPDSTNVTILRVDSAPVLQFSVPGYTVNENAGTVTIMVTKTGVTSLPASINYATVDGTAIAGTNYGTRSGRLDFQPGDTYMTFTVPIASVAGFNPNLAFGIALSNPVNATLVASPATVTINNVDPAPVLQMNRSAYTVNENAGTVTINVTISGARTVPVYVDYATADGTALAGTHYTATSGTLTFAPGDVYHTFTVPVTNIAGYNPGTAFTVTLSNARNATFGTATATVNIANVDPIPTLQFSSATYNIDEDDGFVTLTVSRTGSMPYPLYIDYATSDGNATAGLNYTERHGTLVFQPSDTIQTILVPVSNVFGYNYNTYFTVTLSNPVNATIGAAGTTRVYINNVDVPPLLNFNVTSIDVNENTGFATLNVTVTGTTSMNTAVEYYTWGGSAVPGSDYTATSGTISFTPADSYKTFTVPIASKAGYEADRTFWVSLRNPVNASIGGSGNVLVTIKNVDPQPITAQYNAASYTIKENATSIGVTIVLSAAPVAPVTVSYTTKDGTARAGHEYTGRSGSYTFGIGESEWSFSVPILDDGAYSYPNNFFFVNLTGSSGIAGFGPNRNVSVTITETSPGTSAQFNLSSYAYYQNAGNAVLRLTLSNAMPETVWVDYETHDGTAKAGQNFTGGAGRAEFAPGETYKLIQIPITDTGAYNPNLMFFYVNITGTSSNVYKGTPNVANVTLLNSVYQYTIQLYRGWNIISSPVVIQPFMVSHFHDINANITRVMRYNNETLSYDSYLLGAPADYDFLFTTDMGVHVYSLQNTTLTYVGSIPTGRSASLKKTWNEAGWSTFHSSNAISMCNILPGSQRVMMFDAINQTYLSYLQGAPADYDFAMVPGAGYMIYTDTVTTLDYGGI